MKKPEILAPCGSIASLKGAIAAGADAVYIGGRKFGARAFAENPEETDLLSAIDFVHLNGKKIYMTVNTLLKEKEIRNELYDCIKPVYEQGLDAVIVQDFGVMEFLRNEFPDLSLHASTQMTVTTAYGAELLREKYGITRVVPSRELSLSELHHFREHTNLELECFVHGALCYSYSGQCLFSSMIGGRSGNRGRCAQPCRQKYELFLDSGKINESYAMSLKDMCTLEVLPELIEAGIDSFKIEGRMKKPEYTAVITSCYRNLANLYLEKGAEGYNKFLDDNPSFLEDTVSKAKELYNRGGFSKGYYFSYHGKDMMCTDRPNHSGVKVGTVSDNSAGHICIRTCREINPQDVLEIRGGDIFEFTAGAEGVNLMLSSKDKMYEVNASKSLKLPKGSDVYRTRNAVLLKEAAESFFDKEAKDKLLGKLVAVNGKALSLEVTNGNLSYTEFGDVVQEAKNRPMSGDEIRDVLRKTGEAAFDFDEISVEAGDNIFVPVGAIKKIRRDAFIGFSDKLLQTKRRTVPYKKDSVSSETINAEINESLNGLFIDKPAFVPVIASVTNEEQLDVVLTEDMISEVYIDAQDLKIKEQLELCKKAALTGRKVFIVLPHIFRLKERERYEKEIRQDNFGIVVNSLDGLAFAREFFNGCEIRLSEAFYVTNSAAKMSIERAFDIHRFSASLELNCKELEEMNTGNSEFKIYERVKLMHTAQCLRDNNIGCRKKTLSNKDGKLFLVDKTGAKFPVRTLCQSCMNVIYNSCIYSLIGCDEIKTMNVKAFVVSFTLEDSDETRRVLTDLKNGKIQTGEYTRGHFRRGVE